MSKPMPTPNEFSNHRLVASDIADALDGNVTLLEEIIEQYAVHKLNCEAVEDDCPALDAIGCTCGLAKKWAKRL